MNLDVSSQVGIRVCGPKDHLPAGTVKLTVSSHAPAINPAPWKDLWQLSPFSVLGECIAVPGLRGAKSRTVENAWQFLKIWDAAAGWNEDEAMAAFSSDCAIRFPRGKGTKAVGHHWGETKETLDYVVARRRIYCTAYLEMLRLPSRQAIINRLRNAIARESIAIWDFDSYDISSASLPSVFDTLFFRSRPFAHAFLVALEVDAETERFLKSADLRLMAK